MEYILVHQFLRVSTIKLCNEYIFAMDNFPFLLILSQAIFLKDRKYNIINLIWWRDLD